MANVNGLQLHSPQTRIRGSRRSSGAQHPVRGRARWPRPRGRATEYGRPTQGSGQRTRVPSKPRTPQNNCSSDPPTPCARVLPLSGACSCVTRQRCCVSCSEWDPLRMHPVFLFVRFTAVGFQQGEQHGNTRETKEKHKGNNKRTRQESCVFSQTLLCRLRVWVSHPMALHRNGRTHPSGATSRMV